mgnify:CR=1 FL=1|jgi:hypothetical protein
MAKWTSLMKKMRREINLMNKTSIAYLTSKSSTSFGKERGKAQIKTNIL